MRTTPPALLAALTAGPRKAAECVVLQARDGTVAGFTTWSEAVDLDLSDDGGPGPVECAPRCTLSAVTLAAGFEASNYELTGARGGEFSRAKVLGGKWNHARAWLARMSPGVAGYQPIMRGRVFTGKTRGTKFVLEVRSAAAFFNVGQGSVLQPWCRADFGDATTGCPVPKAPIATTVMAVESAFTFAVDLAGLYPDNHFFLGTVAFTGGALAGTQEAKIFAFDGTTAGIEVFEPLIEQPQVGDACEIARGCSKLLKHADPIIPTCLQYDAVADFRGEPEVPGNRTYQRVTAPGSTYE